MKKTFENQRELTKSDVFDAEREKLQKLFESVEDSKRQLVEALIYDAAFLSSENFELRRGLEQTGMIRCRPGYPEMQKPIEAARQYRQNVGAYAVIIKTLNGILSKDQQEQDDEFDEFIKQHKKEDPAW